jgi:TRAP-type C4-dicarboxylate transport system permease small subunit
MFLRFLRWLDKYFEMSISVVLMSLMTIILFVQVIMRYVFSNSLTWSEELARYLFIWLIYLSISCAAKQMKHIKIEAALFIFPRKIRPLVEIAGDLLLLAFAIFIVIRGSAMMKFQRIVRSPAMGINMSFIYAAPVIGFALTVLRQIQVIIFRITKIVKPAGEAEVK